MSLAYPVPTLYVHSKAILHPCLGDKRGPLVVVLQQGLLGLANTILNSPVYVAVCRCIFRWRNSYSYLVPTNKEPNERAVALLSTAAAQWTSTALATEPCERSVKLRRAVSQHMALPMYSKLEKYALQLRCRTRHRGCPEGAAGTAGARGGRHNQSLYIIVDVLILFDTVLCYAILYSTI